MKIAEHLEASLPEIDKNALVIRLERAQKDLIQLRLQLDSYRCEPKTHVLFEYIENLKKRMEGLSSSNRDIIANIREQRKIFGINIEKAKLQFSKFNQIKSGVADYQSKCINHL